jgi:signal transduction histidine kinase
MAAAQQPVAAEITVPIRYASSVIGTIECGRPRRSGPDERRLVEDLARQVAPALHNARLNRSLEVRLAELTASRARLVQAEEMERRRIERDLHDGIQAQLVAVAAKVDLARIQLDARPERVPRTLDDLASAVRAAHVDLRELVRGIHPAVLSDHGLVRAIEDRTAVLPLRVIVQADECSRRDRLPVHLEGAAYFVAIEGITNVVRHAAVEQAMVTVTRQPWELVVEVVDDGRGFSPAQTRSSGLRGLSDRLQALGGHLVVRSEPGAGTRLLGVLPVPVGVESGRA